MKRLALFSLLAAAAAANAATFNLSTGLGLMTGDTDPNWTVNGSAAKVTTVNDAWTGGSMVSGAEWINLSGDGYADEPAGFYTYTTSFDLSGLMLGSASFNVTWTSDNGSSIFVNGVEVAGSDLPGGQDPNRSYQTFKQITLDQSNASFVSGVNALQFIVRNGDDELPQTPGPIGLKANITGQAEAVPEPASMAALAFGAAALLRRRKKA